MGSWREVWRYCFIRYSGGVRGVESWRGLDGRTVVGIATAAKTDVFATECALVCVYEDWKEAILHAIVVDDLHNFLCCFPVMCLTR